MSNKRHLSPFVPTMGKDQYGHKIRGGGTNPAFLGAQGKYPEKTERFEYKYMG